MDEKWPKPDIPWQSHRSQEEVKALNKETLRKRGMREQPEGTDQPQEQPTVIDNISPAEVESGRKAASAIVADETATYSELTEASLNAKELIAAMRQPSMLLVPLHSIKIDAPRTSDQRIRDLATALAFLELTEDMQ